MQENYYSVLERYIKSIEEVMNENATGLVY